MINSCTTRARTGADWYTLTHTHVKRNQVAKLDVANRPPRADPPGQHIPPMSDEEKTDDESEESGMVSGGHADRVTDRLSKQNAMASTQEVSQLSRGTKRVRYEKYENRRNSRK